MHRRQEPLQGGMRWAAYRTWLLLTLPMFLMGDGKTTGHASPSHRNMDPFMCPLMAGSIVSLALARSAEPAGK